VEPIGPSSRIVTEKRAAPHKDRTEGMTRIPRNIIGGGTMLKKNTGQPLAARWDENPAWASRGRYTVRRSLMPRGFEGDSEGDGPFLVRSKREKTSQGQNSSAVIFIPKTDRNTCIPTTMI